MPSESIEGIMQKSLIHHVHVVAGRLMPGILRAMPACARLLAPRDTGTEAANGRS
jgi:hypothetical protein